MATRNYNPQDLGSQRQTEVTQGDFQPRNGGVVQDRIIGDANWRTAFIANLGSDVAGIMGKLAQENLNQKYLDGAAQAEIVKSEEELQTDPITRDWTVAGYRDTMGKLALADAQATFEKDLPKLREQSPKDFNAYLQARRNALVPALQSMSGSARANAMGQLALQDRAATAKWQAEQAKFIIEQRFSALSTGWNVQSSSMRSTALALGTGAATDAQHVEGLRNAAGFLIGSVWNDTALPTEVKQSLTVDALRGELSKDNVSFYEYMQGAVLPDGTSLLDALPVEDRIKLGNDYRAARDRTSDARNFAVNSSIAALEVEVQEGRYKGTYDDLNRTLYAAVQTKAMSGEKAQGIQRDFLKARAEEEQTTEIAGMAMRGDIEGLTRVGSDPTKGAAAIDSMATRNNLSAELRLQAHVQAAQNGLSASGKRVGEIASPALAQVRNSKDGTLLPQHKQVFDEMSKLHELDKLNGTNTFANVLSGLPEEDRAFAARIMEGKSNGQSYDIAVANAKQLAATEAAMSNSSKFGAGSKVMREITDMDTRGWWGTLKNFVTFNGDMNTLQPYDDAVGTAGLQHVKAALIEEANSILLASPYLNQKQVLEQAQAAVLGRTLKTDAGTITFPRGTTPHVMLGVPSGMAGELSGAIGELLTPQTAGGTFDIMLLHGNVVAQEYNRQGAMAGGQVVLRPADIQAKVKERVDAKQSLWDRAYGVGVSILEGPKGTKINGENSAGVPATVAIEFRENLKQNEGVRTHQYTDSVGVPTFGIGISNKSKYWQEPKGASGQYLPEQIRSSFMLASDDALKAGVKTGQSIGVQNKASTLLFSEIAYQGGEEFSTRDVYKPFLRAMQSSDEQAAISAFQSTPVYKASGESRRRHYLDSIRRALSGE